MAPQRLSKCLHVDLERVVRSATRSVETPRREDAGDRRPWGGNTADIALRYRVIDDRRTPKPRLFRIGDRGSG